MTAQKTAVQSGPETFYLSDQRGPDKASKRSRGGGFQSRTLKRRGASRRRGSAPPLLDSMVGSACTVIVQDTASRKRRRAYHRLRTGLVFHWGKQLRFLTLTLVEGSGNDIHRCFRTFKERVRRLTPHKLRRQDTGGFFTDARMRRYFGSKETWNNPITFEYFSVIIKGARAHMHILYFGSWLPHSWLKKVWREITGDSEIVDIRTTKGGVTDDKRLAGYALAQYALFQDGDVRFQMSQGWTWRGMVRDWKRQVTLHTRKKRGVYKVNFQELLKDWSKIVKEKRIPQTKKRILQTKLAVS